MYLNSSIKKKKKWKLSNIGWMGSISKGVNEKWMETEKLDGSWVTMNSWLLAGDDKQIQKC